MRKKQKVRGLFLCLCMLIIGNLIIFDRGKKKELPYYEEMMEAAKQMAVCEEAVREERSRLGISLSEEDYLKTGLIGISSSPITTTLGAPEAKRTSAVPDMAALAVRILREAGVEKGDRIGACFSGSFPGLNLAVVCGADAIGAEIVYTASVGASSYGANIPEFTGPEMLNFLWKEGLISAGPIAVTAGGDEDLGKNMLGTLLEEEEEVLSAIRARITDEGMLFAEIADYGENLEWRVEKYGEIDCFVNVGGSVAGMGKGEKTYDCGQGLLQDFGEPLSENSGLLERYLRKGIPAIQFLNIKELCLEYGLEYDPATFPAVGESTVYYTKEYSKSMIVLLGACVAAILFLVVLTEGNRVPWKKNQEQKKEKERVG